MDNVNNMYKDGFILAEYKWRRKKDQAKKLGLIKEKE